MWRARCAVAAGIVDPGLERCRRPATGPPTQMHRWRKNPVGDPPIHGGAAQGGDSHHVGDTEERRRSGQPVWNTSAGLPEIIGFFSRQAAHS